MCLGGYRMTQAVRHLEVCSPSTDVDCSSSKHVETQFPFVFFYGIYFNCCIFLFFFKTFNTNIFDYISWFPCKRNISLLSALEAVFKSLLNNTTLSFTARCFYFCFLLIFALFGKREMFNCFHFHCFTEM